MAGGCGVDHLRSVYIGWFDAGYFCLLRLRKLCEEQSICCKRPKLDVIEIQEVVYEIETAIY